MKRVILLTAFLCIAIFAEAQEIDIIGLEIRKPSSPNDNGRFIVGFRVQDQEQFAGVSEKSHVLSIVDDTGFDMLEAHNKMMNQQNASERDAALGLVVFEESRAMPDNKGFLVVIRSPALPAENAKEIQLKAEIIFTILGPDSLEFTTVENINLGDVTSLPWQGKTIPVIESLYRDSAKGDMHRYKLQNEDLGVRVQKIEQVDADGNVIKEIDLSLYPDRTEFSLPQADTDEPMGLKISFKELTSKKIMIDKKFGLGLQ